MKASRGKLLMDGTGPKFVLSMTQAYRYQYRTREHHLFPNQRGIDTGRQSTRSF